MSSIESVVTESRVFPPADAVVKKATISGMAAYEALCKEAEQDYAGYWARLAKEHVSYMIGGVRSHPATAASTD